MEQTISKRAWVEDIFPFMTSLVLHASVIVLGLITIETARYISRNVQEQLTIPESGVFTDGIAGGVPFPGIGDDPTRPMAQISDPIVSPDSKGLFAIKGFTNQMLGGGSSSDNESSSIISVGVGGFGMGRDGVGSGKGNRIGSGKGDGTGDLAPFGMPGGGGGGLYPQSNFMGTGGGGVKSVALVCDASGSMLGQQFDLLKGQIEITINKLQVNQSFDVIFFQEDNCHSLADRMKSSTLLAGTQESKNNLKQFLNAAETRSSTNPIPALKVAFARSPQLIYLLTDGAFDNPGNKEVVEFIRKINAAHKVRINTIAFLRPDTAPSEKELCSGVLSQIAKENGGEFKVVTIRDLIK